MPVDTRDPDLLAERLGIAHQAIHELVTLNEEHDKRILDLEAAIRRSSGDVHATRPKKVEARSSGMSGGFGERSLLVEPEPRSWWPQIAIGATLLVLLVSLMVFLSLYVF